MVLSLLLLVAVSSCMDETQHLTVPYAPVSFRIDMDGTDFLLKTPLSNKIFLEKDKRISSDRLGFAGLLVVSDATGNTLFAYDLCCPYEDSKVIKVIPKDDGSAICSQCKSVFVTMYGLGSVVSGPATESLQRYTVIPLQYGRYNIVN